MSHLHKRFLLNKLQTLSTTYQNCLKDISVGKVTIPAKIWIAPPDISPPNDSVDAIIPISELAKTFETSFEIIPPGDPEPESNVKGFTHYFQSRYQQLETIIKRRADVKDAISLTNALKLPVKTKFKTIGLILDKRAQGTRLFLSIEDMNSLTTVMASKAETVRKGLEILVDQVICFEGLKYRD